MFFGLKVLKVFSHSFYNRAQRKVKRLGEQTKLMLDRYDQVCKAFGENSKRIEPTEFFKYFSDFFFQVCVIFIAINLNNNMYLPKLFLTLIL